MQIQSKSNFGQQDGVMPKSELSDAQPPPQKPAGFSYASLAKKEGGKAGSVKRIQVQKPNQVKRQPGKQQDQKTGNKQNQQNSKAQDEGGMKHFAAIIGHGERGDKVKDFKVPNKDDPPITQNGAKQAAATAQYLIGYFKHDHYKFDKVIIECSPTLRAMMSAAQMAKVLGENQVTINYRATEVLSKEGTSASNMEFIKNDSNFEKMRETNGHFFPEGFNFVEPPAPVDMKEQILKASQPEGVKKALQRGVTLAELMSRKIESESENGTKNVCYLIISHGNFVDQFTNIFNFLDQESSFPRTAFVNLQQENRRQLLDHLYEIEGKKLGNCAFSGFKQQGNGMEPVFSSHSKHLEPRRRPPPQGAPNGGQGRPQERSNGGQGRPQERPNGGSQGRRPPMNAGDGRRAPSSTQTQTGQRLPAKTPGGDGGLRPPTKALAPGVKSSVLSYSGRLGTKTTVFTEDDPILGGGLPGNAKPVKRPQVSGQWANAGQQSMASRIGSKDPNHNAKLNKNRDRGEPFPTLDGSKGNVDQSHDAEPTVPEPVDITSFPTIGGTTMSTGTPQAPGAPAEQQRGPPKPSMWLNAMNTKTDPKIKIKQIIVSKAPPKRTPKSPTPPAEDVAAGRGRRPRSEQQPRERENSPERPAATQNRDEDPRRAPQQRGRGQQQRRDGQDQIQDEGRGRGGSERRQPQRSTSTRNTNVPVMAENEERFDPHRKQDQDRIVREQEEATGIKQGSPNSRLEQYQDNGAWDEHYDLEKEEKEFIQPQNDHAIPEPTQTQMPPSRGWEKPQIRQQEPQEVQQEMRQEAPPRQDNRPPQQSRKGGKRIPIRSHKPAPPQQPPRQTQEHQQQRSRDQDSPWETVNPEQQKMQSEPLAQFEEPQDGQNVDDNQERLDRLHARQASLRQEEARQQMRPPVQQQSNYQDVQGSYNLQEQEEEIFEENSVLGDERNDYQGQDYNFQENQVYRNDQEQERRDERTQTPSQVASSQYDEPQQVSPRDQRQSNIQQPRGAQQRRNSLSAENRQHREQQQFEQQKSQQMYQQQNRANQDRYQQKNQQSQQGRPSRPPVVQKQSQDIDLNELEAQKKRNQQFFNMQQQQKQIALVVQASSAGKDAGDFANITINGYQVACQENSSGNYRGLHMVVINPINGRVELAIVFDTYKSCERIDEVIQQGIPAGYIVVCACKDDVVKSLSDESYTWLNLMGSKEIWELEYRHSFAFIGTAGQFAAHEKRGMHLAEVVQVTQVFMVDAPSPVQKVVQTQTQPHMQYQQSPTRNLEPPPIPQPSPVQQRSRPPVAEQRAPPMKQRAPSPSPPRQEIEFAPVERSPTPPQEIEYDQYANNLPKSKFEPCTQLPYQEKPYHQQQQQQVQRDRSPSQSRSLTQGSAKEFDNYQLPPQEYGQQNQQYAQYGHTNAITVEKVPSLKQQVQQRMQASVIPPQEQEQWRQPAIPAQIAQQHYGQQQQQQQYAQPAVNHMQQAQYSQPVQYGQPVQPPQYGQSSYPQQYGVPSPYGNQQTPQQATQQMYNQYVQDQQAMQTPQQYDQTAMQQQQAYQQAQYTQAMQASQMPIQTPQQQVPQKAPKPGKLYTAEDHGIVQNQDVGAPQWMNYGNQNDDMGNWADYQDQYDQLQQ